jgi:hypothetical protein
MANNDSISCFGKSLRNGSANASVAACDKDNP